MASESAREREVHRFYQPWLERYHTASAPATEHSVGAPRDDGHVPQSSDDRALTAFAQLGALRLNAKRGVIALIDSKTQYILAEATQSLSLMDDTRFAPGDELWLGNARLPRSEGVSTDAMHPSDYTARDATGEEYTAPALVVPDLATDARYSSRKYTGAGIKFYCGVPLISPRGHILGVYNVTDNKRRQGLTPDELRFMRDMAALVVQHLDIIRNERARARGERLIHGIGTFVEGDQIDTTISIESPMATATPDPLDAADQRLALSRPPIRLGTSSRSFKGLTIKDSNTMGRKQLSSSDEDTQKGLSKPLLPQVQQEPTENHSDPYKANQKPKSQHALVFDRAARIMRKCLGADGVAFFDASCANLSKGTVRRDKQEAHNASIGHSARKKHWTDASKARPRSAIILEDDPAAAKVSPDSRSEAFPEHESEQRQHCELIALNLRDPRDERIPKVAEHDLRKLVRRHPQGKAYTFDEAGNLASSDDSLSEGVRDVDGYDSSDDRELFKREKMKRNALVAALPKARTIVLLPMWDFANQRWNAAAVVWSSNPAKMMNVYQDFTYLRAFANIVMNEIARLNLLVSDAAKATFLANISHELRSPLHGILGSIEFLHDTELDDFQSGMVTSVETCGKTLLDTVNHVLDFAKINNLTRKDAKKSSGRFDNNSHKPQMIDFNMAVVFEEAVEAVYAGQVFRAANQDALEGQGPVLSASDKAMATRQRHKEQIAQGQAINVKGVRLTVNIDSQVNWQVTSQPGGIRRIVMNLLGNSLKYTEEGSINVALEIDHTRVQAIEEGLLHCLIRVTDTGIGMSDDFVRNHAFTAFSQEDSLAVGTGLGLSIIRSIVDGLGGKIDLRSQRGLGTEVKIWLSLPSAPDPDNGPGEKSNLRQMAQQTIGLSLCILKPPTHKNDMEKTYSEATLTALKNMPTVDQSLRFLLEEWFSMDVITAENLSGMEKVDFFVYAELPSMGYLQREHGNRSGIDTPVIVLCQNAFQASALRAAGIQQLTEIGRIVETVAQPVGPHKLARVLYRCVQRAEQLKRLKNSPTQSQISVPTVDEQVVNGVDNEQSPTTQIVQPFGPAGANSSDQAETPSDRISPLPPSDVSTARVNESTGDASTSRPDNSMRSASQSNIDTSLPSVLVVDDNQINRLLMVALVRKSRHAYSSATDGMEAVEAYKHSAIDPVSNVPSSSAPKRFKYILMDINMPRKDGITATREIRQWEKEHSLEPPVKILALTGHGDAENSDWAHEAGFDRLLGKPIKFRDLKELLK